MARIKLSLTASPTFKANVNIPVPGSKPAVVEFTFKHRTKDQFKELMDEFRDGMKDEDAIMAIASGWDLEEPFDAEHVAQMVQMYMGSPEAIIAKYVEEQTKARLGN